MNESADQHCSDPQGRYRQLTEWFRPWEQVVVAFSGGVDSTLVLQAACDGAGPTKVIAVTAESPSLAATESRASKELADAMGVRHEILQTEELNNPSYRANLGDRCFYCKSTMYQSIIDLLINSAVVGQQPQVALVDGTNFDDLTDIRPGRRAARAAGVRHPLVELQLGKREVRQLSHLRNLPTWDKPEMACLASRIPVGTEVTADKLKMIELAEQDLRGLGFRSFRVRYHELHSLRDRQEDAAALTLARIELSSDEFSHSLEPATRNAITQAIKARGFAFVAVDLEGYRKGGAPRSHT